MIKNIIICRQIVGTPVVDVRRDLPNATSRAAGDVSLPHTNQRMSGDVGDAHRCDLQHDPLAVTWVCDGHCVGYGEVVAGAHGGVSVRADLCVVEVAVHASAGFLSCRGVHTGKENA